MELSLIVAATIGLLSALHCVDMCGGIVGALSLSLPAHRRDSLPRLLAFVLAYNLGRIGSYALLGALFGGMGSTVLGLTGMEVGHHIFKGVAALIMAGIGLYLGGWLPQLGQRWSLHFAGFGGSSANFLYPDQEPRSTAVQGE